MQSLPDRASVERAIAAADDRLAGILSLRLLVSTANEVADLTHYLVIRPSDAEAGFIAAIGLSPLVSPLDGHRFGEPAFRPWWDWLGDLDGWFEMIIAIGNDGFAFVLLIEDAPGAGSELIELCRTYAEQGGSDPS